MKLNFWQMIGLILLIVGIVLFARKRTASTDVVPATAPAATTIPASSSR